MENQETLLKSEEAYRILRTLQLCDRDEGMYAKEISEVNNQSRNTVSSYLKSLRDLNMIERSKRTRAQYYVINKQGLIDYWGKSLKNGLEQKLTSHKRRIDSIKNEGLLPEQAVEESDVTEEELVKKFEGAFQDRIEEIKSLTQELEKRLKYGGDLDLFLSIWIEYYFKQREVSTLENMLFKDLRVGILTLEERQEYLETMLSAISIKLDENAKWFNIIANISRGELDRIGEKNQE